MEVPCLKKVPIYPAGEQWFLDKRGQSQAQCGCSTAREVLWTLCSAPVKPQCSNPAGPQLLWKEITNVSLSRDICLKVLVKKIPPKQNPKQTQILTLWTQQQISHWWQWWKDIGKYWCESVLMLQHKMASYYFLIILLFQFIFSLALPIDLTVVSTSGSFSQVPPWSAPNWWRNSLTTLLLNVELRSSYSLWNTISITNRRKKEKKVQLNQSDFFFQIALFL